jgi:hypothetical protein
MISDILTAGAGFLAEVGLLVTRQSLVMQIRRLCLVNH